MFKYLWNRKRRCTTNVHAFYHLHEVRERTQQPLHEASTEDFESQYAIVRRSFHGGTRNTPKQVLENMYMRLM